MTSYPEKIPQGSNPIQRFYFNLDASRQVKKDLESQIETLDERINKIIDHFTLEDLPIIKLILNVSHDKDELKKISKALDRVADLIEAKDNLVPKLDFIKTAEKDPNWFALTFGDFSQDIEYGLDQILGDKYNNE